MTKSLINLRINQILIKTKSIDAAAIQGRISQVDQRSQHA